MQSFKDKQGKLYVVCNECTRGGNGDKTCSGGAKVKRYNGNGCFAGVLREGL